MLRRRKGAYLLGITTSVCVAGLMMASTAAISDGIRPSYALQLAGGVTMGKPWRVWGFGSNGERCVDAFSVFRSLAHEDQACEAPGIPEVEAVQVLGPRVESRHGDRTLVAFVTRRSIIRLGLVIAPLDGSGQREVWLDARSPGPSKSRKAHLRQNVGFAVGIVPGMGCVVKIIAIDVAGQSVEQGPCTAR